MNPDQINSVFEGGGAVLLCLNVHRLYRDKTLAGVSIFPTVWWNVWGFWNVYYYHALNQPLSFWAGLGVVTLNTIWVGLALWYRFRALTVGDIPLRPKVGRHWCSCAAEQIKVVRVYSADRHGWCGFCGKDLPPR